MAAGTWVDFPDYPGGEYGLCHRRRLGAPVLKVQRLLEELEQCILVSPCGLEEPSISDCEMVSDGDDERYNTVGLHLAARAVQAEIEV